MSWLLNLYETYEANLDKVGVIEKKRNGQEYTLLPISHTTQNAHIEVFITKNGEFHSASVIGKGDASTLIPCTEDSANRAGSKIAPYPLHDKLSYVAGDFLKYGGQIKKEEPFTYYITQLKDWADSPYSNETVKSIYKYLSKKQLISDLVNAKVLFLDANDKLIDSWDEKYKSLHGDKPPIFSVISGGQESAFVRFAIYSPDQILKKVWKDPEMYQSFINFYKNMLAEKDLCYVTGLTLPATDKHANKIRNAADKAKLISANDTTGFTYRGRFAKGSDVASVSYEVSQKAHNALKWLINRQGKIIDQRVFLVWGNDVLDIPSPTEDTFSLESAPVEVQQKIAFTNEELANEVAKALDGYRNFLEKKINDQSQVNICVLDSATTGRLAVLYYRNIEKELYLNKLVKWHSTCVWIHKYRKDEKGQFVQFYGAPATKDIAFAAYGPKANEKVVKGLMERMLPCILDETKIPLDIIRSAYNRASNPVSMERWEWEKTLSITCALINKTYEKEGFCVALDVNNTNRDYLFGRMLAIADVLERSVLGRDETRATNAIRYMNAFAQHPLRTWSIIQSSIQPYQAKLGTLLSYYNGLLDEVGSKMDPNEFNDNPLSGLYLLGFYSQRHELYKSKKEKEDEKGEIINDDFKSQN